jgi:hypothetical protein
MVRAARALALVCVSAAASLLLPTARGQGENKKDVMVEAQWRGQFRNDDLKLLAPASNFIDNQEDFDKLWKGWHEKNEKTPPVDFKEYLIVVVTTRYELNEDLSLHPYLDRKGDLEFGIQGARGKEMTQGFTYLIGAVRREGIKTVRGKPIAKEK